ncbi:MAG: DUF3473 domain-containing protein [Phycisphaerales bacterium]|nr:MAG: DUF3473 domain-containing protein [Phycisphaerales bacterium]
MLNALTIDLEDWGQSVLDPRLPVTDHVIVNVDRLLDFLKHHGVQATFFALGKVCEQFPQILPAVAECGHEIASHGYGHLRVDRLTPAEFTEDLQRSVDIIESQTGRRPVGYRAPQFSITQDCMWAGPILSEHGFRYSSSIFPIHGLRYGIGGWPRFPGFWPTCRLIEFPVTTLRMFGLNLPVLGGGYTRLMPAAVQAHAIRRANETHEPALLYMHPYELVPDEVDSFRRDGFKVSWPRHVTQALWRSRVAPRLSRLLRQFRFAPVCKVLAVSPPKRMAAPDELAVEMGPAACLAGA